jgi:hypothetical protein
MQYPVVGWQRIQKRGINMVHVTVNSVPVEKVVAEEINTENRKHRNAEVASLASIIYRAGRRAGMRNHSGVKTGRGRVIYSAPRNVWDVDFLRQKLAGGAA